MKKIFTIVALGSFALGSANQYYQTSGNGYGNSNYYPNQGDYRDSYQQVPQNQQYYQTSGNDFDNRDSNQGYYSRDGYQQQQMLQNQQYNQQPSNQTFYNTDEQRGNNRATSDQEINKNIKNALGSGWFSKGYERVTFDVNNGIVTLRGTVDTQENKNKIEESIKKIEGVRQINNQITISKEIASNYSDSQLQNSEKKYPQDKASNMEDRQINARIRDKISNGWFLKGNDTLIIRTANGIVVISGTVEKPEDVQKVQDQVKSVDGVKSVNNQLTVKNK